ncbi:MAG: hypothetical protein VKS61_17530 [Candidatus Sericytochromatia bacterium]|nr:hypothetical protein [Candidatus Sericytochromatia bacterium]
MKRPPLLLVVGFLALAAGCAHRGLAGPPGLASGAVTVTGRAAVASPTAGLLDPYTATDVASVSVSVWPARGGVAEPLEAGEGAAIDLGGVMGLDSPIAIGNLAGQARYKVRVRAFDWTGLRIDDGSTGCITLLSPAALEPGDDVPLRVRLGDKATWADGPAAPR